MGNDGVTAHRRGDRRHEWHPRLLSEEPVRRSPRVGARASSGAPVFGTRPSRKEASIRILPRSRRRSRDEILPRDAAEVGTRTVRAARGEACMTPCILLRRGVRRRVSGSRAGASEECAHDAESPAFLSTLESRKSFLRWITSSAAVPSGAESLHLLPASCAFRCREKVANTK